MAHIITNSCMRIVRLSPQRITGGVATLSQTSCHGILQNRLLPLSCTYSVLKVIGIRHYSSASGPSLEKLWAGVDGVSSQGQKKGRTRKLKRPDAQGRIGVGKSGVQFPGLSSQAVTSNRINQITVFKSDEEKLARKPEQRRTRSRKVPALQRGYSGTRLPGQTIEPPEPIGEYDFEEHGFVTKVIEFKRVANVTSSMGRTQSFSAFVVVGNGNGLVGYALGKGKEPMASVKQAINRAASNLEFVERYNNETVLHNLYAKEYQTKLFIERKNSDYGLCCHRIIKLICEAAGIKNLYAKVEGSTNPQHIVKALFKAFRSQSPFQSIADEKQLYVVESRRENNYRPVVVATPSDGKVKQSLTEEEERALDFTNMFWNNKIRLRRNKHVPFYEKQRGFKKVAKQRHLNRNQKKAQLERIIHGLERPSRGLQF